MKERLGGNLSARIRLSNTQIVAREEAKATEAAFLNQYMLASFIDAEMNGCMQSHELFDSGNQSHYMPIEVTDTAGIAISTIKWTLTL